jgi:hypothetical protein
MSWYCVLCCVQGIVHVKAVCIVFWYKAWSCMIRSRIRAFLDFVFTRYLGITKSHMKIMGQHLVIFSIENPSIYLTLIFQSFGHHQNSHENHGAAPGHHFKIRGLA